MQLAELKIGDLVTHKSNDVMGLVAEVHGEGHDDDFGVIYHIHWLDTYKTSGSHWADELNIISAVKKSS